LKKILELLKLDVVKLMLNQLNKNNENPINQLLKHENSPNFINILKEAISEDDLKQVLMPNDENLRTSIFISVVSQNQTKSINTFWSFLQTILSPNELKNVVKQVDHKKRNAILLAANMDNSEVFLRVFEIFESVLDQEELSEALKLTDYKSSNVLHRSIKSPPFSEEIFEIVLEKVKRLLNVEGVIDMMNHQNFIDETPFGFAMTGRTFIKSLNALKETLSDSDLKRALAKNLDDLIILVLKSSIIRNKIECIEKNWDLLQRIMNPEELGSFFKSLNSFEKNALQLAARHCTAEEFLKIFEIANKTLSKDEVVELLEHVDHDGCSIFHHVACNDKHEGTFHAVLSHLIDFLTLEKVKTMLQKKNNFNHNPLQALLAHDKILKRIDSNRSPIKSTFDPFPELKQLLDSAIELPVDLMFLSQYELDEHLIDYIERFDNESEVYNFFTAKNDSNEIVFHRTLRMNSADFNSSLVFSGSTQMNFETFKQVMEATNADGWNLFHLTACNRNRNVGFMVCVYLRRHLLTDMFQAVELTENRNVFHILFEQRNNRNIGSFFKIAKSILSLQEIKKMFTAKTKAGENMIEIAIKTGELSLIRKLFDILENELKFSKEELKDLMVNLNVNEEQTEIAQFLGLRLID
jgi:hypothetical protein